MRFLRLMALLTVPFLLASACQCSHPWSWFHRTRALMSEGQPTGVPAGPGFQWEKPVGWISLPPAPMRVATFLVPAEDQDPKQAGDASMIVLDGDGGGIALNVNRWREQLDLSPLPVNDIYRSAHEMISPLGIVDWFEIHSDQPATPSMLVALVELDEKTVFIKLVAPPSTLAFQKQNFLSLCKSLNPTE